MDTPNLPHLIARHCCALRFDVGIDCSAGAHGPPQRSRAPLLPAAAYALISSFCRTHMLNLQGVVVARSRIQAKLASISRLRRAASSAAGGVDASLLHAESTASTPTISGRSSARAAATHGMLTATTPLLYTLQRPPAGCSAATARSSVELCSSGDQLFESPPSGVPPGASEGTKKVRSCPQPANSMPFASRSLC